MKLAFLSHTAMGGSFVVGSHQLARVFARRGHQVVHISAPVSIAHLALVAHKPQVRARLKRWACGGEEINGVRDVVPLTWLPWEMTHFSAALMRSYSRHMLTSPLRGRSALHVDEAECLIVDEPRFVGLADRKPARVLIYRATDVYALMLSDRRIAYAEREICERADALVGTSEPVAEHLRRISGREVHLITNGVEFDHFAGISEPREPQGPSLPGQRADRAVYVGAFDHRFGSEALCAAATAMPKKQFLLVGPGGERVAAAMCAPNVVALGAIAYSRLPQVLQQCAVGLLPMSYHAANAGRSPMKLYEYAAAGLAIAATSTQELRRRTLTTLCLANGDAEFPLAVAEAFDRAGNISLLEAARCSAQLESWETKANKLLALAQQNLQDATVKQDFEAPDCKPLN